MTNLVTSYIQHSTDGSYTGAAGGLFTFTGVTGSQATQLGLFKSSGNTTLTATLCSYVSGTVVVLARVAINMSSSTNGTFTYGNILPVILTNGSQYLLYVSPSNQNFSGQDGAITMNGGTPISSGLGLSGDTGAYTSEQAGAFQYGGIDMVYVLPPTTILLSNVAATTWTVPLDWNNSNNTIECIGGGASGAGWSTSRTASLGGGGGGYSKSFNQTLTPGAVVNISVGAGGIAPITANTQGLAGGNTWIASNNTANSLNSAGVICGAEQGYGGNGGFSSGNQGSGGGSSAGVANGSGAIRTGGGSGSNFSFGTGAGGGAGGPDGSGGQGGAGLTTTPQGGAGGGGAGDNIGGGGAGGAASGSSNGINGGAAGVGLGGGAGSTSNGIVGSSGTIGGGGGGGFAGIVSLGGHGGNGAIWGSNFGPGGGGGSNGSNASITTGTGGVGGLFGGGGAGGGFNGSPSAGINQAGNGGQGAILITYTRPSNFGFDPTKNMFMLYQQR